MSDPISGQTSVGGVGARLLTGTQDTAAAQAQKIVDGAKHGKAHDASKIDAALAGITDAKLAAEVRKLVEAKLSPTEVGELRRATDHREAVAAGKPEIVTLKDGTKADGFGVRISGTEPKYEPGKWNKGGASPEQRDNNCYAYAVNDLSTKRVPNAIPQPGERANRPQDYFVQAPSGDYTIDVAKLQSAIAADGKTQGIKWLGSTPESTLKAPKGSYIVALVVDNKDATQDYHWYRHNEDGSWSGKGGNQPATNLDASGNLITDPRTADRNYGPEGRGQLNYVTFVGYYAVTPGAQVGPKP
jgi:hypothetical protein